MLETTGTISAVSELGSFRADAGYHNAVNSRRSPAGVQ